MAFRIQGLTEYSMTPAAASDTPWLVHEFMRDVFLICSSHNLDPNPAGTCCVQQPSFLHILAHNTINFAQYLPCTYTDHKPCLDLAYVGKIPYITRLRMRISYVYSFCSLEDSSFLARLQTPTYARVGCRHYAPLRPPFCTLLWVAVQSS